MQLAEGNIQIKVPVNGCAFLLDLALGISTDSIGKNQDPAPFRMGHCGQTLSDFRATRHYIQTIEYLQGLHL